MSRNLTRREALAAVALTAVPPLPANRSAPEQPGKRPFKYCLNTALLRGHRLPLKQVVEIASQAGYDAVEPWLDEIERARQAGETTASIRRMFADHNLAVPSLIAFPRWIVDDPDQRRRGFEEARRVMEIAAAIGCTGIAAPPAGATSPPAVSLDAAAERYARLLELGAEFGVVPQLEVWGFSATLGKLSEAAYVAIESGQPDATLLLDVYHLYKGGSGFDTLHLVNGGHMKVFHVNDYPANPPREQIRDSDRVYPGDGVAPWEQILSALWESGFRRYLSVEIFNRDYWQQPAEHVATTALQKMQKLVARLVHEKSDSR